MIVKLRNLREGWLEAVVLSLSCATVSLAADPRLPSPQPEEATDTYAHNRKHLIANFVSTRYNRYLIN